jgi:hypothetical protein
MVSSRSVMGAGYFFINLISSSVVRGLAGFSCSFDALDINPNISPDTIRFIDIAA